MKISKSRLLQLTYLAIIIIFSFQSCTTDSDEITTEYDSGIIRDTTTIESVVNLLSDSGQDELNGFVHSCKIDNYHLHLLAYSKDEDLLDLLQTGEAPEEKIYLNYWVTEEPLQQGNYLTEGAGFDPLTGLAFESFFTVYINEVNGAFVTGSFNAVTYGDISPPGFISGSFRTQLIDCSELDITEYDGEYLPGRAEMVIGGQTERVMAGSLFCSEIYELQEFPVGILALGGVMELYDDLELYWEGPYTGLVITEEVENFDEGVKYTARLIQDVEAFIEFTQQNDDWTISDIQDMSVGVYVEYSDIGELFTNGIVTDLEDRTIANFHASTLNCN